MQLNRGAEQGSPLSPTVDRLITIRPFIRRQTTSFNQTACDTPGGRAERYPHRYNMQKIICHNCQTQEDQELTHLRDGTILSCSCFFLGPSGVAVREGEKVFVPTHMGGGQHCQAAPNNGSPWQQEKFCLHELMMRQSSPGRNLVQCVRSACNQGMVILPANVEYAIVPAAVFRIHLLPRIHRAMVKLKSINHIRSTLLHPEAGFLLLEDYLFQVEGRSISGQKPYERPGLFNRRLSTTRYMGNYHSWQNAYSLIQIRSTCNAFLKGVPLLELAKVGLSRPGGRQERNRAHRELLLAVSRIPFLKMGGFEINFHIQGYERVAQLKWHLPGVTEVTGWLTWEDVVIKLPRAYKGYFFLLVGEGLRHSGWVRNLPATMFSDVTQDAHTATVLVSSRYGRVHEIIQANLAGGRFRGFNQLIIQQLERAVTSALLSAKNEIGPLGGIVTEETAPCIYLFCTRSMIDLACLQGGGYAENRKLQAFAVTNKSATKALVIEINPDYTILELTKFRDALVFPAVQAYRVHPRSAGVKEGPQAVGHRVHCCPHHLMWVTTAPPIHYVSSDKIGDIFLNASELPMIGDVKPCVLVQINWS